MVENFPENRMKTIATTKIKINKPKQEDRNHGKKKKLDKQSKRFKFS